MPRVCMGEQNERSSKNEAHSMENSGTRKTQPVDRPRDARRRQSDARARAHEEGRARSAAPASQRASHVYLGRRAEVCHRWKRNYRPRRRGAVHPPAHAARGLGRGRHRGPRHLRSSARGLAQQTRRLPPPRPLTPARPTPPARLTTLVLLLFRYVNEPRPFLSAQLPRETAWTIEPRVVYGSRVAGPSPGVKPAEGKSMKRLGAFALLTLAAAGAARAQDPLGAFSQTKLSVAHGAETMSAAAEPAAKALTAEAAAEPLPAAPRSKFVFGSRDDYRCQLPLGVSLVQFRSPSSYPTPFALNPSLPHFPN